MALNNPSPLQRGWQVSPSFAEFIRERSWLEELSGIKLANSLGRKVTIIQKGFYRVLFPALTLSAAN